MPTFLLIRHAENEYVAKGRLAGRLPGVHLNENGKQQADSVAKAFGKSLHTFYRNLPGTLARREEIQRRRKVKRDVFLDIFPPLF